MKKYLITKISLKEYEVVVDEEPMGGSRPRLIVKHKQNHQKFLVKTYSKNSREIWSELAATQFGELFGIPIQKVKIVELDKELEDTIRTKYEGLLPEDWIPIATLVYYAFPAKFDINYGKFLIDAERDRFTFREIEDALKKKYPLSDFLQQAIADMVIFDALIGNMDRHHQNWGILEHTHIQNKQSLLFKKNIKDFVEFAKLFDHGSSLLFELDESKVVRYLEDLEKFEREYILESKYTFLLDSTGEKSNIFSLIQTEIGDKNSSWRKHLRVSLTKIQTIASLDIARVIFKMPECRMIEYSENRKKLLFESICRRLHILKMLL